MHHYPTIGKKPPLIPEQYGKVIRWMKPYQTVVHKVWGITGGIEKEFINRVKEQNGDPEQILLAMNEKQLRLG